MHADPDNVRPTPASLRVRLLGRSSAAGPVPVRRVRKAYEQVADQLRELIMTGELAPASGCPTRRCSRASSASAERRSARRCGCSPPRTCSAPAKGAGGGSYVTIPSVDHISDFLSSNINLLTGNRDLTLEELIEARMLLEIPAARLAAERRREEDLERLRASIPLDAVHLDTREEFRPQRGVPPTIIECCGNTLLYIAAQPVFRRSDAPRALDPRQALPPRTSIATTRRSLRRSPPAMPTPPAPR